MDGDPEKAEEWHFDRLFLLVGVYLRTFRFRDPRGNHAFLYVSCGYDRRKRRFPDVAFYSDLSDFGFSSDVGLRHRDVDVLFGNAGYFGDASRNPEDPIAEMPEIFE